jgi:hypothetical protein
VKPVGCANPSLGPIAQRRLYPDKMAIDKLLPGDAVVVFTPDSEYKQRDVRFISFTLLSGTHFPICMYAIQRGIHVLVTKPATQLLSHHTELINAAKQHNVVCFVEHHKRSGFLLTILVMCEDQTGHTASILSIVTPRLG